MTLSRNGVLICLILCIIAMQTIAEASEYAQIIQGLNGISCTDLFAEQPTPSIINNFPEAHGSSNWWPVCSLFDMHDVIRPIQRRTIERDIPSILLQCSNTDFRFYTDFQYLRHSDLMIDRAFLRSRTRSHSLSQSGLEREIQRVKRVFQNEFDTVQYTCCGNDTHCRNNFLKYRVPSVLVDVEPALAFEQLHDNTTTGIRLSHIIFNPNKTRSYSPTELRGSVYHELGHACLSYHARRRAESTTYSPSDITTYQSLRGSGINHSSSWCLLTPDVAEKIKSMFLAQAMSEETADCVIHLASNANEYRNESNNCHPNRACGITYLGESFADWFKIRLSIRNNSFDTYSNICTQLRDTEHPLGRDLLQCFLKTPFIRAAVARQFSCSTTPAAPASVERSPTHSGGGSTAGE